MGDFSEGRYDPDIPWVPIALSASYLLNNTHIYTNIGGLVAAGPCQICKDGCIRSQHDFYERLDYDYRSRTGSRISLSEHLADTRNEQRRLLREAGIPFNMDDLWPEEFKGWNQ